MDTSAGIRTRVWALATPSDNHYTTDVLSYFIRCPDPDLNRGQLPLQGSALPTELSGLSVSNYLIIVFLNLNLSITIELLMGPLRFERRIPAMSRRCHNQLDHGPISVNWNTSSALLLINLWVYRYMFLQLIR